MSCPLRDSPFLLRQTPSPPTTHSQKAGPAAPLPRAQHRRGERVFWQQVSTLGPERLHQPMGMGMAPDSRTTLRPCPWRQALPSGREREAMCVGQPAWPQSPSRTVSGSSEPAPAHPRLPLPGGSGLAPGSRGAEVAPPVPSSRSSLPSVTGRTGKHGSTRREQGNAGPLCAGSLSPKPLWLGKPWLPPSWGWERGAVCSRPRLGRHQGCAEQHGTARTAQHSCGMSKEEEGVGGRRWE